MSTKGMSNLALFLLLVVAGLAILFGIPLISGGDAAPDQDAAEVNALLDKYIQAFRTKDLALASEVYAHDADLIVYGSSPSDRRKGWAQTEQYLKTYFAAVDGIEIVLKERNIKVHKSRRVAWFAQVLEWIEAEGGKFYAMNGLRITGVLEKRDHNWVIIQLHASGPPPVS